MNAPERIYTAETLGGIIAAEGEPPAWLDPPRYVRADLFAALEAEKAKAEAERDKLRWLLDCTTSQAAQYRNAKWKMSVELKSEQARADKAEAMLAEVRNAVGLLADRMDCEWTYNARNAVSAILARIKEANANG